MAKFFSVCRLEVAALALALFSASTPGSAQTVEKWPERPVRILVGAPAGGIADIMARAIGDLMAKNLGQPFIVENKPGALGQLAVDAMLAAPRDGYTVMVGFNGLVSEIPFTAKLKYDPFKDLVPVAELANGPLVLVANADLRVNSLKDLFGYVKANPGKAAFASYSPGTLSHVLGLQLNKLGGLDMQHVGYRGAPPALQDVMGGQVQFMFDSLPNSLPHIKGGKVKALAVTSSKRSSVLPDVPTLAELGYPEMSTFPWMAMWTAPDLPATVRAKLRAETIKALYEPAVRQRFGSIGLEIETTPPSLEQLGNTLRAEHKVVGDFLRAVNYKPE